MIPVAVDGDALRHQVFLDHAREQSPSTYSAWLRREGRPGRNPARRQLHDARRDLVGVPLLFVRMLEELLGHALRMNTSRHEVMATIAQDADQFRRQRIVQQLEHDVAVGRVARGNGAFIDTGAGADAHGHKVGLFR